MESIGDTYGHPIVCISVNPLIVRDGKKYGGIVVLKVYPHNKNCTTPHKHLEYVKMQTVGSGYDLLQFNKEEILGTLLDGLVCTLYHRHRSNNEAGK